ncbi:MAG: CRISPR-associated protein Cas5 [Candidatus Anstonellaceae archaeon]
MEETPLELKDYWFLKFKISGWLAQFRDPFTLTTKLTLEVPPKSTILGMIFAKIGLLKIKEDDKDLQNLYNQYRERFFVAIAYKNKKVVKYIDYINYNSNEMKTKPTNVEYLINPEFEIICFFPKEDRYLSEERKKEIIKNEFFKTYFGSNECPAYIEEAKEIEVTKEKIPLEKKFRSEFIFLTKGMEDKIEPNDKKEKFFYTTYLKSFPRDKEHKREICLVPLGEKVEFRVIGKEVELYYYKEMEEKNYFMVL